MKNLYLIYALLLLAGSTGLYAQLAPAYTARNVDAYQPHKDELTLLDNVLRQRTTEALYTNPEVAGLDVPTGNQESDFDAASVRIFPVPVGKTTTLEYTLLQAQAVTIRLFDVQGNLISTLVNRAQESAGRQQHSLDIPQDLPTGFYVVQLASAHDSVSLKILK